MVKIQKNKISLKQKKTNKLVNKKSNKTKNKIPVNRKTQDKNVIELKKSKKTVTCPPKPEVAVAKTIDELDNSDATTDIKDDLQSIKIETIPSQMLKTKKQKDPLQEEKTIFIGNIPSNTKLNQIKNLFSKCTVVGCRFRLANGDPILKHKMRKDSDSINAWVVFQDTKDVETAIKLNGKEFKGRHIRVTKSKQKVSDSGSDNKCTIFVGNLKYSANDEKLHSMFSSCGEIEFVRTIRNNKGCVGVAYVCFKRAESVVLALELNKTLLDDRPVNIEKYSENKSGRSKTRQPEKETSGVERRIMSKLMKDKSAGAGDKLPYTKFGNKSGSSKNSKFGNNKNPKNNMKSEKKKSEFRGVKVESKKQFKKKSPRNSQLTLAKKIAPKD